MKMKCLRAGRFLIAVTALAGLTGCVVYPSGRVGLFAPVVVAPPPPRVYVAPPPVYVAPPPPVVVETEPVMVPEGYTWDGYEYVGLVGDQYFYLGPGGFWLAAEPWRLERFHGWERGHPGWREHAIRNDRYRRDAHGREHPQRREEHK